MTELEIKGFHSADVDNLETWKPKNLRDVYLGLEIEIGTKDSGAADIFQVVIATPEGLRRILDTYRDFHEFGRFRIIVKQYNWQKTEEIIRERVASSQRESWEESVALLCRYFGWEYEDCEYIDIGFDDEEDEDD